MPTREKRGKSWHTAVEAMSLADERSWLASSGDDPLARLRAAVGQEVVFDGTRCRVHDLVDEPPLLVLKPLDDPGSIQADTFGRAARRGPGFIEVPVFDEGTSTLSEGLRRIRFRDPPGRR